MLFALFIVTIIFALVAAKPSLFRREWTPGKRGSESIPLTDRDRGEDDDMA